MPDAQRVSIIRFFHRVEALLWPDLDDSSVARWQVNAMSMDLTDSGGQKWLGSLHLIPGVNGLQVSLPRDPADLTEDESQFLNDLSYAVTALEGSSDNGDRYCATRLREAVIKIRGSHA